VDFERRIADIYQNCRHPEDIHKAFEQLQLDLAGEISDAMLNARKTLLENFDEEVQERLKLAKQSAETSLGRLEKLLVRFTRSMLEDHASFDENDLGFNLQSLPQSVADVGYRDIPLGRYEFPRRSEEAHIYRIQHPLAQSLLKTAQTMRLPPARLHLDYGSYGSKVSVLEPLIGSSGVATVELLTVQSLGSIEEYLLAAGQVGLSSLSSGDLIDADVVEKLLALPGQSEYVALAKGAPEQGSLSNEFSSNEQESLDFTAAYIPLSNSVRDEIAKQKAKIIGNIEQRNLGSCLLKKVKNWMLGR